MQNETFDFGAGGWHVVEPGREERSGGLVAHRGIVHPDEYVDADILRDAACEALGFTYEEITSVYRRGPLAPEQRQLREKIDARLLALSHAGGNMHQLAQALSFNEKTIDRALTRARDRWVEPDTRSPPPPECAHRQRCARDGRLSSGSVPSRETRGDGAPVVGQWFLAALVLLSLYLHLKDRRARGRAGASPGGAGPGGVRPPQLYVLASRLYRVYEESAQPSELLQYAEFQEGVRIFNSGPYTAHDLLAYYGGDNPILACFALEALAQRPVTPGLRDDVLAAISSVVPWRRYFALRVLTVHKPAPAPVVGPLLLRVDTSWTGRACMQFLREFIAARVAGGEVSRSGQGSRPCRRCTASSCRSFSNNWGPISPRRWPPRSASGSARAST